MPDLSDLDRFDQGLPPMNPLPPSEVRRRGDRLRRRNTALAAGAGVLVAALAIGTPFVALGGDGGRGRDIQPAPSPTEPARGWITTIPGDFPLTSNFADEDAIPHRGLAGDSNLAPSCSRDSLDGFVDDLVVSYQREYENREVRILAVYPDADAAAAELVELRDAIDSCRPRAVQGASVVWEPVDADLGTDETFAFAQQVHHADGLVSELGLYLLGRTGNAIYVDHSSGAAGGEQVVRDEVDRLTQNSAEPLERMCVFSIAGC